MVVLEDVVHEGCSLTEEMMGMQVAESQTSLVRWESIKDQLPAANVLLIGSFLALLQLVDGLFTSMGVERFGIAVEGNPLLRHLMAEFGHIPTLASLKILAVLVIVALTLFARQLPWIKNALGAVSCVYLFAAIMPWTYILFLSPYH